MLYLLRTNQQWGFSKLKYMYFTILYIKWKTFESLNFGKYLFLQFLSTFSFPSLVILQVVLRYKLNFGRKGSDSWDCINGNCGTQRALTLSTLKNVNGEGWYQTEGIMTRDVPSRAPFQLEWVHHDTRIGIWQKWDSPKDLNNMFKGRGPLCVEFWVDGWVDKTLDLNTAVRSTTVVADSADHDYRL